MSDISKSYAKEFKREAVRVRLATFQEIPSPYYQWDLLLEAIFEHVRQSALPESERRTG